MTVAMAAPATPICGIPNKPKIMIGSSMMLMIAPVICEAILKIVLPVDCRSRSDMTWNMSPREHIQTIFR